MGSENRVGLIADTSRYEEAVASGILKPGHLLRRDTDNKLLVHNSAGSSGEIMVALEDPFCNGSNSRAWDDAYAVGDRIPYYIAGRGDVLRMWLAPYQTATKGIGLMSNGDGTLMTAPTNGNVLYEAVADSAAIASTAAETAFDKSYTLPVNFLKVGDILHIRAEVEITGVTATPTMRLRLKIGTTVIVDTSTITVATGDTGMIDAYVVIRTIGASGTLDGTSTWNLGVQGTAKSNNYSLDTTAVDTTATQAITLTALWSASSSSNTLLLSNLFIELQRPGGMAAVVYSEEAVDNSVGATAVHVNVRVR